MNHSLPPDQSSPSSPSVNTTIIFLCISCTILFLLPVVDVPDKPGKPKVENADEDSITLTWTKPFADGGDKIQGKTDEKCAPVIAQLVERRTVVVTSCHP